MTRTSCNTGRSGVTLIEILVVLAIIGILLALTSAALQKTVEGQNARSSESQVNKLQQALDMEYERVVAKCSNDAANNQIPAQVEGVCDGNKARAKAVWTAFQLRLNFPESFAEVDLTPLTIYDAAGNPAYSIARPSTFASVSGLSTDPTLATRREEESGVLLYLILAKRSVSGGGAMATAAEDLTQATRRKVTFKGNELETFSDAFKRSVGFRRWEQTATSTASTSVYNTNEVQNPPYVDATKAQATGATANRDPLDPQNLVNGWSLPTGDQRAAIKTGTVTVPGVGTIQTGLYFNGNNRMANVYSLGKTKVDSSNNLTPLDDILGFRLRKQGEKGYKQ